MPARCCVTRATLLLSGHVHAIPCSKPYSARSRPHCTCRCTALPVQAPGPNVAPAAGARKGLLDNYDDAEGYYNFQACGLAGLRLLSAGLWGRRRVVWSAQGPAGIFPGCTHGLTCTGHPPWLQVGELIGEPGGPQYEVYATHGKVRYC